MNGMRALPLIVVGSVIVASASGAVARQLGPHVHGLSELNIAAEGNTVLMELQSPATDIVGFESSRDHTVPEDRIGCG